MMSVDIHTVRDAYKNAYLSKDTSEAFYEMLENVNADSTIEIRAYHGASFTIMAKFEKDIKTKVSLFKEGKEIIEKTILEEPKNAELRLIRLSVQQNAPKLMKYNGDIDEDKKILFEFYPTIKSMELKKHIKNYIIKSGNFTSAEKNKVNH